MNEKTFAKQGPALRFPELEKMEPWESLDISLAEGNNLNLIRNSIQYLQRSRGRKYATKTIPDENAVRVWRKQ